jgi:filamentous hemagglutinin family protein
VKMQTWVMLWGQVISITLSSHCVAQVVPDQTLPVGERSRVSGDRDAQIDGGAVRGNNLFHSFQQFSIPTGGSVSFNNASDVTNIITRVTGNNISDIDGLIQANGTANLFLINPNGILFGANARLEIGGSFLASTADSFRFSDGFAFSATSPQASPLLTVSAPIGLQYGRNSGAITVRGSGHNLTYDPVTYATILSDIEALQVQPGRTLALVGGDIILEGGNLRAAAGRIELGSVAFGNVSINENDSGLTLGYSGIQNFSNILLSQKASVDVSGEGGGSIQVQSRELSVNEGSAILSITTGANPGGDLTVNATESVNLLGESADQQYASVIFTESQGAGSSGNLVINTRQLLTTDGAYASTFITASGNGGNLIVKASDSVELTGTGIFASGLYTGTSPGSAGGNSGDVLITTDSLTLADGGQIYTSTNDGVGNAGRVIINVRSLEALSGGRISTGTFGAGNAGRVVINATDSVKFDGQGSSGSLTGGSSRFSSGIISQVNLGATGSAGGVSITTDSVEVLNGAQISTSTFASGDAGSVTINANTYESRNGGLLLSETYNKFSAGNLILNIRDSITLSGRNTGIFASASVDSTGGGGSIIIDPGTLIIQDGAAIAADNQGIGIGGGIQLTADSLALSNGTISANTRSNTGGNITLNLQDLLLLRNNSQISTTAGNQKFGGDGGDITLDSPFIVAVPQANSNISANAFSGRGGNIRITTQGLFGIESRDRTDTGLSSITASSEFGVSGTIDLNTPDIDPSQGIAALPSTVIDTDALLASSCIARRSRQGRFVVTGTGGLAPQPDDLANSAFPTYELMPQPPAPDSASVIEADRIEQTATGEIVLGRSCE